MSYEVGPDTFSELEFGWEAPIKIGLELVRSPDQASQARLQMWLFYYPWIFSVCGSRQNCTVLLY